MISTYKLSAIKDNKIEYITTSSTLKIGTIIGWGYDENEPDKIKKWKVHQIVAQLY